MRRFATAFAIVMMLASGCSSGTPAPAGPDLEFVGVENASSVVWSPSGHRAVVQSDTGGYLLDVAARSLTALPAFTPAQSPTFWSESEVVWLQDGRLQLRDLVSGQTRMLNDFGESVTHFLRPGDTHYVVTRPNRAVEQGHPFGKIVAGALNSKDETVVIDTGYLVGRMADGNLLAVEGPHPRGPLWSISSSGEKQLVSQTPVSFVQIAPDGLHALWLTGDSGKPPAQQDADYAFDPPLTDLWTWDRTHPPVRVPLGGAFSARAGFAPDGSRIALALNQGFANTDTTGKPGTLAVAEGGKVRHLATFAGRVRRGMWFGSTAFQFNDPNRDVTGGSSPITLLNRTGKQEDVSAGQWYYAQRDQLIPDTVAWAQLIMHWRDDGTTVQWADSDQTAHINFNPNDHLGNLLYVPPKAPYLPIAGPDRLWLKWLTY